MSPTPISRTIDGSYRCHHARSTPHAAIGSTSRHSPTLFRPSQSQCQLSMPHAAHAATSCINGRHRLAPKGKRLDVAHRHRLSVPPLSACDPRPAPSLPTSRPCLHERRRAVGCDEPQDIVRQFTPKHAHSHPLHCLDRGDKKKLPAASQSVSSRTSAAQTYASSSGSASLCALPCSSSSKAT